MANATNCDVFRVFDQDTDDVIKVINYLIERAENHKKPDVPPQAVQKSGKAMDDFWDYV